MTIPHVTPIALLCALALACTACRPESGPAAAPVARVQGPAAVAVPAGSGRLEDVVETTSGYILGISYPQGIERHPGLAQVLKDYADGERRTLAEAVAGRGAPDGGLPYDMSLSFVTAMETPKLVVVRADGSRYTGGERGQPLLRRFVWLPVSGELLGSERLLADPAGWQVVADAVREHLATRLSKELDEEDAPLARRAEAMRAGLRVIDQAVRPEAAALSEFEPVLADDGRIRALRFVFAPWQEWNYAQDQQTAEVPAALLLPYLAPDYRGLFVGGG